MEGLGESHPFFFLPLPPVSNDLSDDHARIMVSRLGGWRGIVSFVSLQSYDVTLVPYLFRLLVGREKMVISSMIHTPPL